MYFFAYQSESTHFQKIQIFFKTPDSLSAIMIVLFTFAY